ncbi:MAG: KH domain-containing protein [Chloroflexi bacterium]|nr:KH domain-containing protein [Chloroflexota bacterium]
MRELVEYIALSLVENPDEVVVTEHVERDRVVVRLQVASEDMGKVIGKEGRIAQAMRTLMKVAATSEGLQPFLVIGPTTPQ